MSVNLEADDPKLGEIFSADHTLAELTATERFAVIEEIVQHLAGRGLVTNPQWLATALRERERMVPTAVPNGVAFLHARSRDVGVFPRQFLFLARSTAGVDFGSPDGRPTHLFFLLAFRKDMAHLRWLARLSWVCRRRAAVTSILKAKDAGQMARQLELAVEDLPPNLRPR